jgi:hypothetical protein
MLDAIKAPQKNVVISGASTQRRRAGRRSGRAGSFSRPQWAAASTAVGPTGKGTISLSISAMPKARSTSAAACSWAFPTRRCHIEGEGILLSRPIRFDVEIFRETDFLVTAAESRVCARLREPNWWLPPGVQSQSRSLCELILANDEQSPTTTGARGSAPRYH